jgi:hypothetical protein
MSELDRMKNNLKIRVSYIVKILTVDSEGTHYYSEAERKNITKPIMLEDNTTEIIDMPSYITINIKTNLDYIAENRRVMISYFNNKYSTDRLLTEKIYILHNKRFLFKSNTRDIKNRKLPKHKNYIVSCINKISLIKYVPLLIVSEFVPLLLQIVLLAVITKQTKHIVLLAH